MLGGLGVVKVRYRSLLWSFFAAPAVGVVPRTCLQPRQTICQLAAEEVVAVVIRVHSVLEAAVEEERER